MQEYRVTRSWVVLAPDEDAARDAADNRDPDGETIRPAGLPTHRYGASYEQSLRVLDAVWDEYMDRSLPPDVGNSVRLPLPSLPDLVMRGVEPPQLSLLFDGAVSAYRRYAGE